MMHTMDIDKNTKVHYNPDFSGDVVIAQNGVPVFEDAEKFLQFAEKFTNIAGRKSDEVHLGYTEKEMIAVGSKDFSAFAKKIMREYLRFKNGVESIDSKTCTEAEYEVINLLSQAWNKFIQLEQYREYHTKHFMDAIHKAQHLVMIRPTIRNDERFEREEGDE